MLRVCLLGKAQVLVDDQELHIPRRKSRAVLYYLAAQTQPIRRQQLLALLWPDLPRPAALQTLRTTLHGLRRQLDAALAIQSDQVGLDESVWVDVRFFEGQLNGNLQDVTALKQGLELYRGDFLEGFTLPNAQAFEDWLTVTREHFRRLAMRGWTALAAWYETQGDFRHALDSLDRALALNPLQEDLQREVIRLLYIAGDRPGAIRRYDELRRMLDEEMGVPPMVETRVLYDAILTDRLASTPPQAALTQRQPILLASAGSMKTADELPFTGRRVELAALQQQVKAYPFVLIEGEPGVGKTRLAQEFSRDSTALTLLGRGRELEQALPYQPIVEALRQLMLQPGWAGLLAELQRQLPRIWLIEAARLLPELSDKLGEQAALRPAEEARLWEGIRQFLVALSRRVPLILLIDDLQWADTSTLGLLGFLARQIHDPSIRILATLRPGAQRDSLMALLQSLTRENRLSRLLLQRLNREDIQEIAGRLSASFKQPLADWLYRLSEGNAYILVELVRHARQSNLLTSDGVLNLSAISAKPIVPQTVYSMIQTRLQGLSDEARRVLDAAVAQGREFEFEIVAQAAGLSEMAALDAIDELRANSLISVTEGNVLRFDHTLTMEVAYREVGELRHRLLHRRVAEALESQYRDHLDQIAGQLAWHFAEGGALQRAAPYALKAGAQAANLAAWSESGKFYELALQGLSDAARLPALQGLAEAYSKAGNYARACDVLREAITVAKTYVNDPALIEQLQLSLARNLMPQARFVEVIELAEQLCAPSRPESAVMAELLWGTALGIEGAALDEAAAHLNTAQELWQANRISDLSLLSQIQFELGNVLAQQGELSQAVQQYRRALDTASQAQADFALEQRILALNNLAYHLHLLDDPEAKGHARAGLELAQEKGVLGLQAYLYSTLGEISLAANELAEAESLFNHGLALAERFSIKERVAGLTANLGLVAARRGEIALAIHRLSTALAQADTLGTRHLAAKVRLWLAPLLPAEQARQLLTQARAIAEESGRKGLLAEIGRLEQMS
jgi:DNA-binding SARP family transcriptional activator